MRRDNLSGKYWRAASNTGGNDVLPREPLNKSENYLVRHSGACQNPVKTIVYWMLVFTSMTLKILIQSFPKCALRQIPVQNRNLSVQI